MYTDVPEDRRAGFQRRYAMLIPERDPDFSYTLRMSTDRRDFLKLSSISALAAPWAAAHAGSVPNASAMAHAVPDAVPPTPFPRLAMIIVHFTPQKVAFAAETGYQGVLVHIDNQHFNPDTITDRQIAQMQRAAREAACPIISLECMWGCNHIDANPVKRRRQQARFIRGMHIAHELGCKFLGTFSGGMKGATGERQARELAEVFNEKYLPLCEKLDLNIGWENYPCSINFAISPGLWKAVFDRVPSPRLGLEFDPSHLVRQFIDPYAAAWEFKDRIHSSHAKDTEITQPILQNTGILGEGWWRYRIPGQGLMDWPRFITVLLHARYNGALAVEQEDPFWNSPKAPVNPVFPVARADGFRLAQRYLSMFLPGRLG